MIIGIVAPRSLIGNVMKYSATWFELSHDDAPRTVLGRFTVSALARGIRGGNHRQEISRIPSHYQVLACDIFAGL